MDQKEGILLTEHFENFMSINGESTWVIKDYNASTGYRWEYRPDNSGTTELLEVVTLHPATKAVGVAGKMGWKFKALKNGSGEILFELFPPGQQRAIEKSLYKVTVK
jgi:Predicted secreted protein